MKKLSSKIFKISTILAAGFLFSSCYSVFSGGTGGMIVDAESTTTPKTGISNVDVYAYTDCLVRDLDYLAWKEGSVFTPSNSYYGHTTTGTDGSFTISKLVWKEEQPDFGRDADFTTIYLLYYHEKYGLTKDATVIISDSTNSTVYAELTSIRKTTALNINIYDAATSSLTTNNVLVKVTVPQSTDTITAEDRVYESTISGNGTINISYPRWKNDEDKASGKEMTPTISISYAQSADEITWKACANGDNADGNYAFLDNTSAITKTIENNNYSISLYGKSTKLSLPTVDGYCGDRTLVANDGKIIKMMGKDASGNFTIDCGETTTSARTIGTNGSQDHGYFSGLGSGATWTDTTYTGKYATIDVKFYADGSVIGTVKTFRSDTNSYTVNF